MSLNFFNKRLLAPRLWLLVAIASLLLYLSPLLGTFYVPTFDNLDSIVPWYKMLADNGMIFADLNATVPQMMNGLPRSSFPGDFNVILWLYYFFAPKTAFIINEVAIHIIAFISMYVFLHRYIVPSCNAYSRVLNIFGALYFSLIPYWSGAGASVALLPLVTYSLLNIKFRQSQWFDWILLLVLPLYTHFVFLYMFYIFMAGIYLVWDAVWNRSINIMLLLALTLMGSAFLASDYRLVAAMFVDNQFVSHRTEFDIFFKSDFLEAYEKARVFFLVGHISHDSGLQNYYIVPMAVIGMLLSFIPRRFNVKESMMIWVLIVLSFVPGVWQEFLTHKLSFPAIFLVALLGIILQQKHRMLLLLILLQMFLACTAALDQYKGMAFFEDYFPILRELNVTRIAFVSPFVWGLLFVLSMKIIVRKLHFSIIFLAAIMGLQIATSFEHSFYQWDRQPKMVSFEEYFAPKLFAQLKKAIPQPLDQIRVVSYGVEPAVTLYNGFYTLDGYCVNYPLQYKHEFRKVIADYLSQDSFFAKKAREVYDDWGGKVYILTTTVTLEYYSKDIVVQKLVFDSQALCDLGADYMISSMKFQDPKVKDLTFVKSFVGTQNSWDIYLYKFECHL